MSDLSSLHLCKPISFEKLDQKDGNEIARLLTAGETDGFFYLDLTSLVSMGLWEDYKNGLAIISRSSPFLLRGDCLSPIGQISRG